MNTKNNILIALFERETAKLVKGKGVSKNSQWIEYRDKKGNYDGQTLVDMLAFHQSYDSLMLVVEKIETLPNTHVDIKQNECFIVSDSKVIHMKHDSKIEAIYFAVVRFIEWYNKQK